MFMLSFLVCRRHFSLLDGWIPTALYLPLHFEEQNYVVTVMMILIIDDSTDYFIHSSSNQTRNTFAWHPTGPAV